MNILSCNYNHDGSAAILSDGKIKAYLNTERFSRIKKHPGVTKDVFDELFKIADLSPSEIDMYLLNNLNCMFAPKYYSDNNGYFQNTWENFLIEDVLEPQGEKTFVDVKDYGLDKNIKDFFPKLKNNRIYFETHAFFRGFRRRCIINLPHYLSHASTVYYTSPFKSSIIFVWDPTGFEAFVGKGNNIYPIFNDGSLNMVNLGRVYAETSEEVLGEDSLSAAGKMMGLSAYGNKKIDESILDYNLFLNRNYNNLYKKIKDYSTKETLFYKEKNKNLNATKAFLAQSIFENQLQYIFKLLYQYSLLHDVEPNICLSGGSTLNCIANEKAFKDSKFKNIFLHPACGDDGTSIGSCLFIWHEKMNNPKLEYSNKDLMYSKKEYSQEELLQSINLFKNKINYKIDVSYVETTARFLSDQKIIAWFDGGSEIGPRALGHRSILADPRSKTVRDFLNGEVKGRESYRPLAPSILAEYSEEWFGIKDSPFMLRAAKILKDTLPGISHIDNTSRPQTVKEEDNPNYYNLIKAFFDKTGIPMILDTSFNVKGEPIVETPIDAINTFLNSKIDVLVFPNLIITKNE